MVPEIILSAHAGVCRAGRRRIANDKIHGKRLFFMVHPHTGIPVSLDRVVDETLVAVEYFAPYKESLC
jgi:hypothetical protein